MRYAAVAQYLFQGAGSTKDQKKPRHVFHRIYKILADLLVAFAFESPQGQRSKQYCNQQTHRGIADEEEEGLEECPIGQIRGDDGADANQDDRQKHGQKTDQDGGQCFGRQLRCYKRQIRLHGISLDRRAVQSARNQNGRYRNDDAVKERQSHIRVQLFDQIERRRMRRQIALGYGQRSQQGQADVHRRKLVPMRYRDGQRHDEHKAYRVKQGQSHNKPRNHKCPANVLRPHQLNHFGGNLLRSPTGTD